MWFAFATSFCFQFRATRYITGFIRTSSKKLLSSEFGQSFGFQFQASRYFTGLNRILELKVLVVCICYELLFSISSVSIYYGTQSDIEVKSSCVLHFLRASVFNFEHLDILQDSFGHPSKKLLSFELSKSLCSETSIRHPSKKLLWFEF